MNKDDAPLPHLLKSRTLTTSAWRFRLAQQHGTFQAVLVLLMIGVLFAPLLWFTYAKLSEGLEARNTPLLSGNAVVTNRYMHIRKGTAGVEMNVSLRIDGQTITTSTTDETKWLQTNIGDTVKAAYRIGARGSYFIYDWQAPPRKVDLPR